MKTLGGGGRITNMMGVAIFAGAFFVTPLSAQTVTLNRPQPVAHAKAVRADSARRFTSCAIP